MSKRYVQHKSGIGEKWEVCSDTLNTWTVRSTESGLGVFTIPKSEYIEVPAPEQWELITALINASRSMVFIGDPTMRVRYDTDAKSWVIERLVKG